MGQSKKADRFSGGLEQLGAGPMSSMNQSKQFDRLDTFAKLMAPPPIKFKDLEAFMTSSKILTGPPFLFDVRTDYVKVTNDTVLVPLTLQMQEQGYHVQHQGRRGDGHGEYSGPGDEHQPQGRSRRLKIR